ncbi:unnamed protein product [Alopecurus aequalis]
MSPPTPSDSGARVPAATEMEDAAAGGIDGAVTTPPSAPTCPVCMETWTCDGAHRICCIPCGHVYGRLCLERWLHRCGERSAKCPQCGEQFEQKHITNLYAPGNLWDGCCRLQELKAQYDAEIKETPRCFAEYMEETQSNIEKLRSELIGQCTKLKEHNSKEIEEFQDRTRVEIESSRSEALQMADQVVRMWNEEKATANGKLETMKERMKKMAEEENATATELIEFVEQTFPRSSVIPYQCDFASVSAPAPDHVDSENTSPRLNRPDQLLPASTTPCPADAASKRRRQGT